MTATTLQPVDGRADRHERLVVALAHMLADEDRLVVGVGTPIALAAGLLARATHAPGLVILAPGVLNPPCTRLLDHYTDPLRVLRGGEARLTRIDILRAMQRGDATVQFVRPAQVDAAFRMNTTRVESRGRTSWLVGCVALPDVVELLDRVIVYVTEHSPRVLPATVDDATTASADELASHGRQGGVDRVVTPLATITRERGPTVTDLDQDATLAEVRRATGFDLRADTLPTRRPAPTVTELEILRSVIDPEGFSRTEWSDERAAAIDRCFPNPRRKDPPR